MNTKDNESIEKLDFPKKNIFSDNSSEEREAIQQQILNNQVLEFEDKDPEQLISYFLTKAPQSSFNQLINQFKDICISKSKEISNEDNEMKEFLEANPVPIMLENHLSPQTRTYNLLLQSLKDWIIKEQIQSDQNFLGTGLKRKLVGAFDYCLISGDKLGQERVYLEYGIKDGRLPLPLSVKGHEIVENAKKHNIDVKHPIEIFRARIKKKITWRQIYNGCLSELGFNIEFQREEEVKKYIRRLSKESKMEIQEILDWIKINKKV